MIESATGIILRTRPLTETSLIVNWLTPDLGRLSTVAKGARRSKSPFAGKLDLFYEADFSFSRSRRSDLHALREVSLREPHVALREELGYLQQASYAAALIEQTTETETPLAAVHELMRGLLAALPQRPPQPRTIYAFELKLLNELGLRPDLDKGHLSASAKKLVTQLLEENWPAIATLSANADQARELRQFLHGFLIFHLGKIPHGRDALLN
jgi:DNA repair protein RecO (recombination protein O)